MNAKKEPSAETSNLLIKTNENLYNIFKSYWLCKLNNVTYPEKDIVINPVLTRITFSPLQHYLKWLSPI